MAEGPTTEQILKKRDSDLKACEATAQQERTARETASTPLLDSIKNLALYGPGGKRNIDLYAIEQDERVCKAKANIQADNALLVRAVELEGKARTLDAKLQAETIRVEGADKATAIYREAFGKAERRAAVAEQLAEACFFPKRKSVPRPALKGDNGPQEATLRPPQTLMHAPNYRRR